MSHHAEPVDSAEGAVWAEGIRARAFLLAERGNRILYDDDPADLDGWIPWAMDAMKVLREIAGAR